MEDTFHITPQWDIVGGISYDYRNTRYVEDYTSGALFKYDVNNLSGWNFQGAVIYRYSDTGKANFSVSRRISMPNMFHRFSSRFGTAASNPDLKAEKGLNFELAVSDRLWENWFFEVAVFHNRIDDLMQAVRLPGGGSRDVQNQNIGKGKFTGFEIGVNGYILPELEVGANYSYTNSDIDISNKATSTTLSEYGVPKHKGMVYAKWNPIPELSLIPYVEWESSRKVSNAAGDRYINVGSRALVNFKIGYELNEYLDFSLTGRNLLDKNYEIEDGYPQEGRDFILTARFRY